MSKQFKLHINTGNDAFGDTKASQDLEIARILRQVANRIERGDPCHMYRDILDLNGNIVGKFALKDE